MTINYTGMAPGDWLVRCIATNIAPCWGFVSQVCVDLSCVQHQLLKYGWMACGMQHLVQKQYTIIYARKAAHTCGMNMQALFQELMLTQNRAQSELIVHICLSVYDHVCSTSSLTQATPPGCPPPWTTAACCSSASLHPSECAQQAHKANAQGTALAVWQDVTWTGSPSPNHVLVLP